MSDRALTALRCAAAVLHCTSGVGLRLSHDGVPLFDISHPPFPDVDHTVLPTCRFRAAVLRAHTQHSNGHHIAMCGLPAGIDPQLSYGVQPHDRVLPGGTLRLERDHMWLHVTALARSEPGDRVLGDHHHHAHHGDPAGHCDHGEIRTLSDEALDVSVVCIATAAGDTAGSTAALDCLSDLAALVAVAEIEAHLAIAAG
jgi:hypothetical protein